VVGAVAAGTMAGTGHSTGRGTPPRGVARAGHRPGGYGSYHNLRRGTPGP